MTFLVRLLGIRKVESPGAVRITLPRWIVRLLPGALERTREKILREHSDALSVRIVGRSIIARFR